MKPLKIGVVNWDASLPPDTYFGMYTSRSLCPKKYRSRTPFYAHIVNENKIEYNYRTLEEFDKAIETSPEGNSQLKTLIYSRASCLKKLVRYFVMIIY